MNDVVIARSYTRKARQAAERGIDFDLTFPQFKKLYNSKKCHYSGMKILHIASASNCWTIDRVNPAIGYTKENCVASSQWANYMKNNLVEQQISPDVDVANVLTSLQKICSTMQEHLGLADG